MHGQWVGTLDKEALMHNPHLKSDSEVLAEGQQLVLKEVDIDLVHTPGS